MKEDEIINPDIAELDEWWVEIMPYGRDFIEATS